jgi:hypothetical protein
LRKVSTAGKCALRSYGAGGEGVTPSSLRKPVEMSAATQIDDLSRSLVTLEQDTNRIAVVELGRSKRLGGGSLLGVGASRREVLEPGSTE